LKEWHEKTVEEVIKELGTDRAEGRQGIGIDYCPKLEGYGLTGAR